MSQCPVTGGSKGEVEKVKDLGGWKITRGECSEVGKSPISLKKDFGVYFESNRKLLKDCNYGDNMARFLLLWLQFGKQKGRSLKGLGAPV